MVTVGSTVRVGDVLAEIDQKELGDEVVSATAELARLREEDARMTQLDLDEALRRHTPKRNSNEPCAVAWSSIARGWPPTARLSRATRA